MARRDRREFDEDDGRTIAPMDVDGMPWVTGRKDPPAESSGERREMSRDEARGFALAAVTSALLIGGVFAVAYGLFLLFCRFVWLT